MTFPTTLIQIEAHPVECYRALFNDVDESTGRRVRSMPYPSREAALEAWAPHGATEADIQVDDARVDALRAVLHELEVAFENGGSKGVTTALAQRDLHRAQSILYAIEPDCEDSEEAAATAPSHLVPADYSGLADTGTCAAARSFSREEVDAEPTVNIAVPFGILESAAVKMHFTRAYPSTPENWLSPDARLVLEYMADCEAALLEEEIVVATGGFWPEIHQGKGPFKLHRKKSRTEPRSSQQG